MCYIVIKGRSTNYRDMNFKVGDKVKYAGNLTGIIGCIHNGTAYMSQCVNADGGNFGPGEGGCCFEHNHFMGYSVTSMELVEEAIFTKIYKEAIMGIVDKWKNIRRSEPKKSMFKAGVIDQDEKLTVEGKALFDAFLLERFGEEFKKEVIDPILAEEEDK